jgi:hypothetical protein
MLVAVQWISKKSGRLQVTHTAYTKLRAVKVGGKWRLTEISKKQRTIFEKLETSIPVEADLVIKKAELRIIAHAIEKGLKMIINQRDSITFEPN